MVNLISPKQAEFLKDLLNKRQVPVSVREMIEGDRVMTSMEASLAISTLLAMPRVVQFVENIERDALAIALAAVPTSRYALNTVGMKVLPTINADQPLLFLELREYRGRRKLLRLVGAPGDFLRYSIPTSVALSLLEVIARDPRAAAQRFGAHYSVCGKCAAPLTDEESRRQSLGPVCRKAY